MPSARSTTGLPPGVHVGATRPRLLAALVEVGPAWLLVGLAVVFAVAGSQPVVAGLCGLLALGWAILVWAQRATRAAGPGMRLAGLQIVGFHDGRPIGWGRVLARWLAFAGLTLTVVGLIAMLVVMSRHPRRQGWHDRAADAVVIKERPLAPPRSKPAVARTAPTRAPDPIPTPDSTPAAATSPAPIPADVSAVVAADPLAAVPAPSPAPTTTLSPTSAAEDADDQPAEANEPDWWLRLDDGRDIGDDRLVLLGRNPQPRVGEEDATLITVSDEGRTVSKSHLAVGVDAGGLYVMDRGSTNGTTVTAADGGQRPCPPGDLIDVTAGSVISFGDHWLEVRRPDRP